MAQSKPNQWRDSSREVKFFIFDSKLSFIFLIWLLNITNLNRMMVNKVNPLVTKPCFIINLFIITSTHSHQSD